jgi:hypothetical protein
MHLAELAKLRSRWGPHGRRRVARRGTLEIGGTLGTTGTVGTGDPVIEEPRVLRPFNRGEALSIAEAARLAGRSVRTFRDWCARLDIGRRIGGQWAVSRVALAMFLMAIGKRFPLTSTLTALRHRSWYISSGSVSLYYVLCLAMSRILHSYWPPSGQKDICSVGRAPRASPFNKH